jgi:hypothetical protein
MTLGAFSTQLPTASVMLMRYADIAAERDLESTCPAMAATDGCLRASGPQNSSSNLTSPLTPT